MQKLYLASSSSWRLELLRNAGLQVEAISPNVDEDAIFDPDPIRVAMLRAEAKAVVVHQKVEKNSLVIGADQVIYLDGKLYGKPKNQQEWLQRLLVFRGETHLLTTAVSFRSVNVNKSFFATTKIHFRDDISDAELEAYVNHGEARYCAGGYMVEKLGGWMIKSIEGDWLNVVGLPMFKILDALRECGWNMCTVTTGERVHG